MSQIVVESSEKGQADLDWPRDFATEFGLEGGRGRARVKRHVEHLRSCGECFPRQHYGRAGPSRAAFCGEKEAPLGPVVVFLRESGADECVRPYTNRSSCS